MRLRREDVLHVAALCRIALSDKEVETLQDHLSGILDQFEHLKEVNTDSIAPMEHSGSMNTVTRDDCSVSPSSKEDILTNAPRREGDFFRVLPVLEDH
jgi:aspartyl-tRNA(Asn)/glutamyl-tRNA(Gln) amidotransferase subunit C